MGNEPNLDEPIKESVNHFPKSKASFLSKLVYFWAGAFIWRGYHHPITKSDIWPLQPSLTSNKLVEKFEKNLKSKLEKNLNVHVDESAEMISKENHDGFSILPALVKTFGISFFIGALMQIIATG